MNTNNKSIWPVLFIALFAGVVIQAMLTSCAPSDNSIVTSPSVDRSSGEYRYAKERFRQEGYSDKDARTAADAVLKFHNAQKNR